VLDLVNARQEARNQKDWAKSDRLRDQILALGWQVKDTPDGPQVESLQQ
jgi:cysteinyl-tRNA synthetase